MLLIVQHVTGSGGDGFNAYVHHHGEVPGWVWVLPEGIPDRVPGHAVRSVVRVRGPARVRSFLDLAFPDDQSFEEVQAWAHDALVALIEVGGRLPLSVTSGPWFARFELEHSLAAQWHEELHRLLDTLLVDMRSG